MSAQLHGGKFTVGGRGGVSRRTSIEHPASRGRGRARTIKTPASPTFRAPSGPAQVSLPSRRLPLYYLSRSLSINITSYLQQDHTVPYQPTPSAEDHPVSQRNPSSRSSLHLPSAKGIRSAGASCCASRVVGARFVRTLDLALPQATRPLARA
jgi:hypothetical protein